MTYAIDQGECVDGCRLSIVEEYDIVYAQQESLLIAGGLGLCRLDAYTVATAVSELASNLVRHARGGTLTLQTRVDNDAVNVEVTTDDEGPGIANIEDALKEGFSTKNGLGCGLPGVQRLMDALEIASTIGQGTHVMASKRIPLARTGTARQSSPIQSNPIQSNPIQSNPIQSNPIQSNPIQSNPIQSNPIQS